MQYTIRDECSRAPGTKISAIVEALAEMLCPPKYRMRFKHPTTPTFADGHLKIGASSLFTTSRIKDHFLSKISFAVPTVTERFLKKLVTALSAQKNINTFGGERYEMRNRNVGSQ